MKISKQTNVHTHILSIHTHERIQTDNSYTAGLKAAGNLATILLGGFHTRKARVTWQGASDMWHNGIQIKVTRGACKAAFTKLVSLEDVFIVLSPK